MSWSDFPGTITDPAQRRSMTAAAATVADHHDPLQHEPTAEPISFQAHLDTIGTPTGRTPRQLLAEAQQDGFGPGSEAAPILARLADAYDLGRGHGMALVHVITKGPTIADKHVGASGSHADASTVLWLDGQASRPW